MVMYEAVCLDCKKPYFGTERDAICSCVSTKEFTGIAPDNLIFKEDLKGDKE